MRKVFTTRTVLLLFLAVMSLGSYVFLNTVTLHSSTPDSAGSSKTEVNELKALDNVDVALPDVLLLKKVIEVGKRILPAS